MHTELPWGVMIVIYLYAAGVSAGVMIASNIALLKGGEKYGRIIRWGAYIAPFPIALGTGMLLLDLGSPFNFYRLFMTLQVYSPMSYGSWAILLFVLLSIVNLYLWLPERYQIIKRPANKKTWQRGLAKIMPVLSIVVASYTGVLLGAGTRPLWNPLILPVIFLVSALSTGVAAVIFVATISRKSRIRHKELHMLTKVDMVLIVLELALFLVLILVELLASASQRTAIDLLLVGHYAWMFWILIIGCGLFIPFILEIIELKGRISLKWALPMTLISSFLVLFGGFFVRYVITLAGQLSGWLS